MAAGDVLSMMENIETTEAGEEGRWKGLQQIDNH